MRQHKLMQNGVQIGGGMSDVAIVAFNGPLNWIDVQPADRETIGNEHFEGAGVFMQVADRRVWLEPEDVRVLVENLQRANHEFFRRWREADPDLFEDESA